MRPGTLISSGGPWESKVGYSRAVRFRDHVAVSGCAAVDQDGNIVGVEIEVEAWTGDEA